MKKITILPVLIFLVTALLNAKEVDRKPLIADTPEEVIENYIKAIGGKDKLKSIRNMQMKMEASIQGMTLEISATSDQENKRLVQQTAMDGNVMQKTIVKDGKGIVSAMGQEQTITGEQLESVNSQLYVFPELHYDELGYEMNLQGKEDIEGEEAYVIALKTRQGGVTTEYYSVESGLKLSTKSEQAGNIEYSDYQEIDGIKIPMKLKITNAMLPVPLEASVTDLQFNQTLSDSDFE